MRILQKSIINKDKFESEMIIIDYLKSLTGSFAFIEKEKLSNPTTYDDYDTFFHNFAYNYSQRFNDLSSQNIISLAEYFDASKLMINTFLDKKVIMETNEIKKDVLEEMQKEVIKTNSKIKIDIERLLNAFMKIMIEQKKESLILFSQEFNFLKFLIDLSKKY